MKRIRRLIGKTNTYHRLSDKPSLLTFGSCAKHNKMLANMQEQSKRSSVFEKIGQKITNIKEDIADNIERRKQLHNNFNNNQIHFTPRTNQSEDSLVIEKKLASTPIDIRPKHISGDDGSMTERSSSVSQLSTSTPKKTINESEPVLSNSIHDIFSAENNEHAKDIIKSNVRQGINRSGSGALSEASSDDSTLKKIDQLDLTLKTYQINNEKAKQKFALALAGPKFRSNTLESKSNFKHNTIYPVSILMAIISILAILIKPLSSLMSGFILGFMFASAIAYIIARMYLNIKPDESSSHEWIEFPELESMLESKVNGIDRSKSSLICCEIGFGQYDPDQDEQFARYPALLLLETHRLMAILPAKTKVDDKKDKEIKLIGYREYGIQDAKLTLVPEKSLTRVKYWLEEYPIVLQNLYSIDKQIRNKQSYEKSKFNAEEFFNNNQTTLSVFFETCPDKEDWFYKFLFSIRKSREEGERTTRTLINTASSSKISLSMSSPSIQTLSSSVSDTQIPSLALRNASKQSNADNSVRKKSVDSTGSPSSDTASIDKSSTELLRNQVSDVAIMNDMTQARIGTPELRFDTLEKDNKKTNDKDSDKDSCNAQRTSSIKKKFRKQEENLKRILDSPDCLDQAAIALNFLLRRVFCDIFEEPLFKDLLKEKIERKLKELAVSVLDDLHVDSIDLGQTFPVILKVDPMQWNTKGLWFNLFIHYRGSFKATLRTRIVLQRILNVASAPSEQPIHYQHRLGQIVSKVEERIENDQSPLRSKSLTKESDVPENAAARKLGIILTKVAGNKHVQRIAAFKPVAGVIEKISNSDVGVNIELLNLNGIMTINIPPPPSDRIWIGFSEMPDLNLKVTPVFGESKYSYTVIHDFLEAQIRDEIKRLLVLPAMDDQLLPFFRDWVLDTMSDTTVKSSNI